MVLVLVVRGRGRVRDRRARRGDQGSGSPPRSSRRSASGSRCCSPSATQDFSILADTLGAEALSGGSVLAALLAALAVGGWVFIGFDACVGAAEETHDAARHVPRAIWIALLSVGVLVILNAVAVDARASRSGGGRRRRATSTRSTTAVVVLVRVVVGQAVRRGRARRVPGLRHGGAGAHRADDLLDRARRRAARLALPAPRRPARVADRRDRRDRGRRVPRAAARAELGGGRQPDRVRHRGDLRRVPAGRARRADRARARDVGPGRHGAARPRGAGRQRRSRSRGSPSRR